jgi:hypothetical protein
MLTTLLLNQDTGSDGLCLTHGGGLLKRLAAVRLGEVR